MLQSQGKESYRVRVKLSLSAFVRDIIQYTRLNLYIRVELN